MNPDVLIALVNLDEPTPEFFVDEMWSKGDPRCIAVAREIVSSFGTSFEAPGLRISRHCFRRRRRVYCG